jgi:hypothetical protein
MRQGSRGAAVAPWLAGVVLAVVVVGPGLAPGSLLNLDLVLTPVFPVPRGIWALGPELSRRVPLGVFVAWASVVVGGPLAGKVLLLASLSAAFVGVYRLADGAGTLARVGAGLLYAAGPFTLTRVAVGHLGLVAAMALLPWAARALLRPAEDMRRTWIWSVLLGATGITGGMYAATLVASGLVADRGRHAAKVLGVFVVAQLPWIVPGVFTVGSLNDLSDPHHFATHAPLPWGPLRVVAGAGFWRAPSHVGGKGAAAALLGAGLLALAVLGASRLSASRRGRLLGAAMIGLVVTLASTVPGVRSVFEALTETAVGASLRDSQRLLAPFLLWLAVAAAFGASRLAKTAGRAWEPTVEALPAVAAAVLAAPGLWGVGGALEPATFPTGWARARTEVQRAPGPVLALPFHEYLDLSFADRRRVLNPVPDYFGGDVLVSSDPELDKTPAREQGDPREKHVPPILEHPERASPELSALGIRWVVLLHEVDWRRLAAMEHDPGLQRVVATDALDLYRVRGWRGPVVDDSGRNLEIDTLVQPWSSVGASGPATWTRPATWGWLRGTSGTGTTSTGLLRLPAGSGPVWYWPAALALAADAVVIVGLAGVVVRHRRRQQSVLSS